MSKNKSVHRNEYKKREYVSSTIQAPYVCVCVMEMGCDGMVTTPVPIHGDEWRGPVEWDDDYLF